jgi:effector-binding domain-containing protein
MISLWRVAMIAAPIAFGMAFGAAAPAFAQSAPPAASDPPPPPPPAPKVEEPKDPKDPFGAEVTLTAKTIIYMKGNSTWDKALDNLQDAFKSVYALLEQRGIAKAGPAMTIYTQADDTGFTYQAAVPIAEAPKDPPKGDIGVGQSPAGKALKFVHRGSYESMDNTYEAITNYLDEKRLEAADSFIEEYETDPVTTPEDKFVVTVYVPLK